LLIINIPIRGSTTEQVLKYAVVSRLTNCQRALDCQTDCLSVQEKSVLYAWSESLVALRFSTRNSESVEVLETSSLKQPFSPSSRSSKFITKAKSLRNLITNSDWPRSVNNVLILFCQQGVVNNVLITRN